MSAHPREGHASNLRSGRPNAPMHVSGQGGRPRTMILGMATVAAALGGFWLLQFKVQNRSHLSADPAEMPTWQFRHAQQSPEFNARMSTPGGSPVAGRNPKEPNQYMTAMPAESKGFGGGASSSGMVSAQSRDRDDRGLASGGSSERGGEAGAVDPRGKDNQAPTRNGDHDRGIVSSIMTSIHGDPRNGTQNEDGHVGQPAATPSTRLNDRGLTYTKNSDFKDGFRRD